MRKVEEAIGEPLEEFLPREYSEENLSVRDICQNIRDISGIKIGTSTLFSWLRQHNVTIRAKEEAVKLSWKNPNRLKRTIRALHSPKANIKRSEAMIRNWQELSEPERRNRLRGAVKGPTNSMLNHMRELLGDNPKERIYEMQKEHSYKEIAEELGIDNSTFWKWRKNLGI